MIILVIYKEPLFSGGFMNKACLLLIVLIIPMNLVNAQETSRFSLGTGIEGNLNARNGMALGINLSADYTIIPNLAAGLKFGFSHNFKKVMALEPELFARWYFLELSNMPLFVQADMGATILTEAENIRLAVLGGITAGIHIPLENWYVEPYIRTGYPFIVGAGVSAGYLF
jgi:hypothetical protein